MSSKVRKTQKVNQIPLKGDITVETALGYTPENTANKGVVNGYASLDGTGKVPLAQLPTGIGGGNDQLAWMKI